MAETKATIETKFGNIELKFFLMLLPITLIILQGLQKRILRWHDIPPRNPGLYDTGRRSKF